MLGFSISAITGYPTLLSQSKTTEPKKYQGEQITISSTLNAKALEIFLEQYRSSPVPICLSKLDVQKIDIKPNNFPPKHDVICALQVNNHKNDLDHDLTLEFFISSQSTISPSENHSADECKCAQHDVSAFKCAQIGEMLHVAMRYNKNQFNTVNPGVYKLNASSVVKSILDTQKWDFIFKSSLEFMNAGVLLMLLNKSVTQASLIPALKGVFFTALVWGGLYKEVKVSDILSKLPSLLPLKIDYDFKENSKPEIDTIPKDEEKKSICQYDPLDDEIRKIQSYGKLRGRVSALNSRNSLVMDPENSYALPEDILIQIFGIFFNELIKSNEKEAHLAINNFAGVCRSWWKACSKIVIPYEQATLSKDFSSKIDQFPLDMRESIKRFADQSVGIFYLYPKVLKSIEPSKDADPAGMPEFIGIHTKYNTSKSKFYPYANSDVKYFTHPEFGWATTLVDFITWPLIENFSLLYIEDPFKRPILAMPYKYSQSGIEGKGIFILQQLRVDEKNNEWWLLIDKPMEGFEAKVICFLHEYQKEVSFQACCANCKTADSTVISKHYLNWLNEFLSGQVCEDLPSSVKGYREASSTERRVKHYVKDKAM